MAHGKHDIKTVNDNSINIQDNSNNIEIYKNKIEYYADDYITNVLGISHEEMIGNPSAFAGMMKHIYMHLFKANPAERKTIWVTGTNLDLDNIELLDQLWDVYTGLCYRYQKKPTILNFAIMVGVANDTITTWINGTIRGGTSSAHSRAAKRWKMESESALFDGATEKNSIGCIFALKACHGYAEAAQEIRVTTGTTAQESREEIAQKYADSLELPEPEAPEL